MDEWDVLERAQDLGMLEPEFEVLAAEHPGSEAALRSARQLARHDQMRMKNLRTEGYYTVQEAVGLAGGRRAPEIRHLARAGRLGKIVRDDNWPHQLWIPVRDLAAYLTANPYKPSGPKGPRTK
jgi:hypothetical protein